MKKCFFLGANSSKGFYSLYDKFPPKDGKLHIIKAGPGTGKSTFMKKIAEGAECLGMDVEYILCSGDPNSLDGIYISQLNSAWVDGTSPHVKEPDLLGVNSDYVNLGQFLSKPFSKTEAAKIRELNQKYKSQYTAAYSYLSAAQAINEASIPDFFGESGKAAVKRRIGSIIKKSLGHSSGKNGTVQYRFISAHSCLGEYRLNRSVNELCKLKYQFDSSLNALPFALEHAAAEAVKKGADVIICPSPLCPEKIEALLIPSYSLAFLGDDWEFENSKCVHIDNLADAKAVQQLRAEMKEAKKLEKKTMELAYSKLHCAKALHDELEELYKSHMDFSALSKFTDNYIKALLH